MTRVKPFFQLGDGKIQIGPNIARRFKLIQDLQSFDHFIQRPAKLRLFVRVEMFAHGTSLSAFSTA